MLGADPGGTEHGLRSLSLPEAVMGVAEWKSISSFKVLCDFWFDPRNWYPPLEASTR